MINRKMLKHKGFTLIEMLVVIVVLAALLAIALPRFFTAIEDARTRSCAANIRQIDTAIELCNAHEGAYPAAIADLSPDYLPDGIPICPMAGPAYVIDANNRCDRTGHFTGVNWPNTHD